MKTGYQIQIQKDLSPKLKKLAIKKANQFIQQVKEQNGSYRFTSKHKNNFYTRGVLGYVINSSDSWFWYGSTKENFSKEDYITFRRISKNRRIFGIVKCEYLKTKDNSEINYDQCFCSDHLCGTKVTMPIRPEMEIYYTCGDIKG